MGSAHLKAQRKSDWEEHTMVNDAPAARFGAEISGERPTLLERAELADLFDDEESPGEFETRVREVPSALLRAAAPASDRQTTSPDLEQTLDLEKTRRDPQLEVETPLAAINVYTPQPMPLPMPDLPPPPMLTPTPSRAPVAAIVIAALVVIAGAGAAAFALLH